MYIYIYMVFGRIAQKYLCISSHSLISICLSKPYACINITLIENMMNTFCLQWMILKMLF